MEVAELGKAEELYRNQLEQSTEPGVVASYHHQLDCIKCGQGNYRYAIRFYEKKLDVF